MFVVIEGLDAVGKTTLVESLAKYHDGEAANTPGPSLKCQLNEILAALGDNQIARALFYSASVFSEGQRARDAADSGQTVFMDRYWLSTISYARARGVSLDLSSVEAMVPVPDLTVLLALDERERQRRLTQRGLTDADKETLDPVFRETVLREMRSCERRANLRPVEIDVTGANRREVLKKVSKAIEGRRRRPGGIHAPRSSTAPIAGG